MRIIAGTYKGRRFDAPKGHKTHPMSERMRNAMFNTLHDITELSVFDAYGGSGALAFEAISRGAERVDICEIDQKAASLIQGNIHTLGLESEVRVSRANCASWLKNTDKLYDLILADPPYDDLKDGQLNVLVKHVKPTGLLVLSHPADFQDTLGMTRVVTKQFAGGNLSFYKF